MSSGDIGWRREPAVAPRGHCLSGSTAAWWGRLRAGRPSGRRSPDNTMVDMDGRSGSRPLPSTSRSAVAVAVGDREEGARVSAPSWIETSASRWVALVVVGVAGAIRVGSASVKHCPRTPSDSSAQLDRAGAGDSPRPPVGAQQPAVQTGGELSVGRRQGISNTAAWDPADRQGPSRPATPGPDKRTPPSPLPAPVRSSTVTPGTGRRWRCGSRRLGRVRRTGVE